MSQIFKSYRCSELLKGCNRLHNILGIALQISDWTLELPETLKSHKSAGHSWPLPLHVDMCFFLSVSIFMWMTCHFLLNYVKTLSCSAISPFFSYSPQLLCPVQSHRALGLCTVPLLPSHFTYRFPLYLSLLALGCFLKSSLCSQWPPTPACPWYMPWLGLLLSRLFFLISSKKQ